MIDPSCRWELMQEEKELAVFFVMFSLFGCFCNVIRLNVVFVIRQLATEKGYKKTVYFFTLARRCFATTRSSLALNKGVSPINETISAKDKQLSVTTETYFAEVNQLLPHFSSQSITYIIFLSYICTNRITIIIIHLYAQHHNNSFSSFLSHHFGRMHIALRKQIEKE